MGLLLAYPGIAHEGTNKGLQLFFTGLFPYLLPYVILTGWLLRLTARYDHLSRLFVYIKIYVISSLGGFPTGAVTVSYFYKKGVLHDKEGAYLLAFCHFPSPLFCIGFVGMDLLQNTAVMWRYLAVYHAVSLIFVIFTFFIFHQKKVSMEQVVQERFALLTSIKESVPTVAVVAATIVFFTTIHSIIAFIVQAATPSLLAAIALEMTTALSIASTIDTPLRATVIAFILTTQSLSIHTQVAIIAQQANLSLKPYIFQRLLLIFIVPIAFYFLMT